MKNHSINKTLFQSPLHSSLIKDNQYQLDDSFSLDSCPSTPDMKKSSLKMPPAPKKLNPYKQVGDMSEHVQRVLF